MKQNRNFLILGVTGGAGSGKTTVVEQIKQAVPTVFLHCDVIAHKLMEPGGASYAALVQEFGEKILEDTEPSEHTEDTSKQILQAAEGTEIKYLALSEKQQRPISRPKLAKIAMATEESRKRLNELTHPLVQQAVENELKRLEAENFHGVAVIEAALLIEAGYKSICDSLWYVHAPLEHRIRRMKEYRGYSDEKIANILAGQLSEEEFKANADVVIENPDGGEAEVLPQILAALQNLHTFKILSGKYTTNVIE